MAKNISLEGKKSVVTGAAKGIGKSIATYFAELGSDLALVDVNEVSLKETAEEIRGKGRRVYEIVADLTSLKDIERIARESVEKLGEVDVLVNNAGVSFLNPAEKLTEEEWDKTLAVNLKGLYFLSQAIGRHMIEKRSGKIVNIASQAAVVALEGHVAYCASKAGVVAVTKVLALEWGKYNINVNAIAPTIIMTPMGKKAWSGEKGRKMLERIPLGRFGEPEEVAYTAAFLASDLSDMITGTTIMVDGGYTIQ
ncbi:MAG TPA: D-threitol dehydrogenase [Candidatus Aerophobetes bacterium]|uniref:D-threitol dehydrogenase n=1 Tax=Aerophobetes bacterium TaxID=2030807 RepID=A0A7V5M001_UNCAE|nr:D-threitol dehydrogenase [Candidatus Aerophobetes bacterium]